MIHPFDRQTDGRAIAYYRYSIYAIMLSRIKTHHRVIIDSSSKHKDDDDDYLL